MKILCLSILAIGLFIGTSQAQNFEGTITFKIEFKGRTASGMAGFSPSGMIYQRKGEDIRFETQSKNDAHAAVLVVKGKKKLMYFIKDSHEKTYKIPVETEFQTDEKNNTTITIEDEEIELLGYKCQKYKVVEKTDEGKEIIQYVWATKDIKVTKPVFQIVGGYFHFHIDGIEGFPLKLELLMTVMGEEASQITIATEVDTSKLNKSVFEPPKGYKVEEITIEKMKRFF